MAAFDLCGALRRIRRRADLSQRELAEVLGVAVAVVSHAEAGRRGMTVELLARIAGVAGLRLTLVDDSGAEVAGMADGAVCDQAGRRYPAHLDTRYGDQFWWHGPERYSREQPWYTFDRVREWRDHRRERLGTPEDHQLPQPGDSPRDRQEARRRVKAERRADAERRWREKHRGPQPEEWTCTCPPGCAELDVGERPVHARDCGCGCDIG